MFLLPKIVLNQIEKKLRDFLWTGPDLKSTSHKVRWKDLCAPKCEGGLNFRVLSEWNKAAISKHVWSLVTKAHSLWSNWVHLWLVRRRSFWELPIPSDCSWSWRKILSLRPLLRNSIKHRVCSGTNTLFWVDNWHPLGPLLDKYGPRVLYDAASNRDAKVSDFISMGSWNLPHTTSWELQEIELQLPPLTNSNNPDVIYWTANASGKFSTKSAWNLFRSPLPSVPWFKLVWASPYIPKHSFILWLAIKGKLTVKQRLFQWGVVDDDLCPLCLSHSETIAHLFFECNYSTKVWTFFGKLGLLSGCNSSWDDCVIWFIHNSTGKLPQNTIHKLLLPAMVHALWLQRNNVLFERKSKPPEKLAIQIFDDVRVILMVEAKKKKWDLKDIICQIWRLHY